MQIDLIFKTWKLYTVDVLHETRMGKIEWVQGWQNSLNNVWNRFFLTDGLSMIYNNKKLCMDECHNNICHCWFYYKISKQRPLHVRIVMILVLVMYSFLPVVHFVPFKKVHKMRVITKFFGTRIFVFHCSLHKYL
jgi:hypothetical protein